MKQIIIFSAIMLFYADSGLCQDPRWPGKYGTNDYLLQLNHDSTFYIEKWNSFRFTSSGKIAFSADTIFIESTNCRVNVVESTTEYVRHNTVSIIRASHNTKDDYVILYVDTLPFLFVQLINDTVGINIPEKVIDSIAIYYRYQGSWVLWSYSINDRKNNTFNITLPETCPITFFQVHRFYLISGRNKLIGENGVKWKRFREKPLSRWPSAIRFLVF